MTESPPAVTIGIVSYYRFDQLEALLHGLIASVAHYGGPVSVVIANNAGAEVHDELNDAVSRSGLGARCDVRIVDPARNNISVARNELIDVCETRLLAFLDDDEIPDPEWLAALVEQYLAHGPAAVAGPVFPRYSVPMDAWVAAVDLHNTHDRHTGDRVRRVGSGNCLLDRDAIGDTRFDERFGATGGADGDFFETLSRAGAETRWSAEAVAWETIPPNRSTASYMRTRFMAQGRNFARFMLKDASTFGKLRFRARALSLALVGITLGTVFRPFNAERCAYFWKGGFTNLGKLWPTRGRLYGQARD